MATETAPQEYFFAWEGAPSPWDHLRVISFYGHEALSELYWFEVDVHRDANTADVDIEALIGTRVALKWLTRTEPGTRIVHGVVSAAVELGDVTQSGRYRITIKPPVLRAALSRGCHVHLGRTLRTIIEDTLRHAVPAIMPATEPIGITSDHRDAYSPPRVTFQWRILNPGRLDDVESRPYCVRYLESSWAFISRLLEEEGIAYHFEHGEDECRLVFTDDNAHRTKVQGPVGPELLGREVPQFTTGARLRPRSVRLDDYHWERPRLELEAASRSGPSDFQVDHWPGRYHASSASGTVLATAREERLDTERHYAVAEGRCRVLAAGALIQLRHPKAKFEGQYLVTAIEHEGHERGWFPDDVDVVPYRQKLECMAVAGAGQFRPARLTPWPRIYGTQTAVVTAEPGSDAEINVGGPSHIGCVRVRFHWDTSLRAGEPSSCWVRVSQFFAGAGHGALWHPRVGNEVLVEFEDGDPDRPLVTGRVYNGTNLPPVGPDGNATERPTYSAIQSLTSPFNGNFNKLSFEDLQGEELIHMHAARDMTFDIERNYTRNTKAHDAENAGSQSITVGSTQDITVGTDQTIGIGSNQIVSVGANQSITVGADQGVNVGGAHTLMVGTAQTIDVGGKQTLSVGADQAVTVTGTSGLRATSKLIRKAPIVFIGADAIIHEKAGASMTLEAGSSATVQAPEIVLTGSDILVLGPANVTIASGEVNVNGGIVNVRGDTVNVDAGAINLNC